MKEDNFDQNARPTILVAGRNETDLSTLPHWVKSGFVDSSIGTNLVGHATFTLMHLIKRHI